MEPVEPLNSQEPAVAFGEVIAALTYALDLTSNGTHGHTLRACLIGLKIGRQLQLQPMSMSDLYYALLLKDLGCSSNAADMSRALGADETVCKAAARTFDWSRFEWQQLDFVLRHAFRSKPPIQRLVGLATLCFDSKETGRQVMEVRCNAGERIAHGLGLSDATASSIRNLDEHWDGRGQPEGLRESQVPLLSQICNMAQTLEIFERMDGRDGAVGIIEARSGQWFDPDLVRAAVRLHEDGSLWEEVPENELLAAVMALEPQIAVIRGEASIDDICLAFAEVVDAKSHYTHMHSQGVARIAEAMGRKMGLPEADLITLRRAALLHDIGKLGVPNTILDKRGELTAEEWGRVFAYPVDTYNILRRIRGFEQVAAVARSHHERLDGTGYPDKLKGDEIPLLSRILAVADMYDALSSERPLRKNLSPEQVLQILEAAAPHTVDAACVAALRARLIRAGMPESAD